MGIASLHPPPPPPPGGLRLRVPSMGPLLIPLRPHEVWTLVVMLPREDHGDLIGAF